MINPYQPPHYDSFPLKWVRYPMNPWTQVALIATSITFGAGYQLVQNLRVSSGDPIPIWPHLTIPTLISIAAAIRSKNLLAPPLAALAGIVAGLMVFAAFRGLRATQLEITLPIALLCSIPSLCIASLSWSRFRAHRVNATGSTAEQWDS
jgi:phosphatidylserine synthase